MKTIGKKILPIISEATSMTMQDMLNDPLANVVLMHTDDKLMLGHMQSDWTGLGPILEEDIAASAMSQDDLSHAMILMEWLAEKYGLDVDSIGFRRRAEDYRCCDLATVPDDFDWAVSLVRRWLLATFSALGIDRLATTDDASLAARCQRIQDEQAIQLKHLNAWMVRLGSGTDESRERMQKALELLTPEAGMMFEPPDATLSDKSACCCGRDDVFQQWTAMVTPTLRDAGLTATFELPDRQATGGRRGVHATHFIEQLAEMTEVIGTDADASW